MVQLSLREPNMDIKQLETEALKLARHERASLAQTLLHSLDETPEDFDPEEYDRAWAEEIQRRLDDWDKHPEKGIPLDEVLRKARAPLIK